MEYMTPFVAEVFLLTLDLALLAWFFYLGATWDEKR